MAYKRPDDGLKATTRYLKKCDTITIRPLKAEGERIRSAAEKLGYTSLTKFVIAAIDEFIENHSSAPSAAQPAEEEEEDYSWLFEDEEN